MIQIVNGVKDRVALADLCNELRITVAAEIGTDLAVYACQFLDRFVGDMLLCIDPYAPYGQMPYNRDGDLLAALLALARHHGRAKLIRESSPQAAIERRLPDWYKIGFIYIDGDHGYEPAKADIAAWWEVLDDGGILAGHDWDEHEGVQRAVREFAESHAITVHITQDRPASWYVFKPGLE